MDLEPKPHKLKIILVGDEAVGKTQLMSRYVSNQFSYRYKATIGADFLVKKVHLANQCVTLQIWDTAGQERFQSLGFPFFQGADAIVLVYDVTNEKSFSAMESWYNFIRASRDVDHVDAQDVPVPGNRNLEDVDRDDLPLMLIANKCDMQEDKKAMVDKGCAWCAQKRNTFFYEASAATSMNVQDAFAHIARLALGLPNVLLTLYATLSEEQSIMRVHCTSLTGTEVASVCVDVKTKLADACVLIREQTCALSASGHVELLLADGRCVAQLDPEFLIADVFADAIGAKNE